MSKCTEIVQAYLKIPLALLPLASCCVLLLRLGAILSSGPRKRSMKESGRSSSSSRLLCAHSLSLTTRLTSLTHTRTRETHKLLKLKLLVKIVVLSLATPCNSLKTLTLLKTINGCLLMNGTFREKQTLFLQHKHNDSCQCLSRNQTVEQVKG